MRISTVSLLLCCLIIAGCGKTATVPLVNDELRPAEVSVSDTTYGKVGSKPLISPIWVGGELYGTTSQGTRDHNGCVYGLTAAKDAFVLYSFEVRKSMQERLTYFNGVLYGVDPNDGPLGNGSVFGIDRKTGKQVLLYRFGNAPDAGYPGLLTNVDGLLYASGNHGGKDGYGALFDIDPITGKEQVVYSFQNGADGRFPTDVASAGDVLFGATYDGGANNAGTIFAFDTTTKVFKVLYTLPAGGLTVGNFVSVNSKVFGEYYNGTNWTIFSIDPATDELTTVSTGAIVDQFIAGGKILYGHLISGGKYGFGEIATVDQGNGTLTTVYDFPARELASDGITFGNGKFYSAAFPFKDSRLGEVLEFGHGYQKTLYTF